MLRPMLDLTTVEVACTTTSVSLKCLPNPNSMKAWEHLADVEFPIIDANEVGVLIGTDCPEMMWTLEERKGKRKEPVARRTLLGWVVIGPTLKDSDSTIARCDVNLTQVDVVQEQHSQDSADLPSIANGVPEKIYCEEIKQPINREKTVNSKHIWFNRIPLFARLTCLIAWFLRFVMCLYLTALYTTASKVKRNKDVRQPRTDTGNVRGPTNRLLLSKNKSDKSTKIMNYFKRRSKARKISRCHSADYLLLPYQKLKTRDSAKLHDNVLIADNASSRGHKPLGLVLYVKQRGDIVKVNSDSSCHLISQLKHHD